MSRTFKDMSGGVRERRRGRVLGRERARERACAARAPLGSVYDRRGGRKQERRLTNRTERQEDVG